MTNRASLIAASPRSLKGATFLAVLQAIGWAVLALTASGSAALSHSHVPRAALLGIGALFLAGLSVLPMAVALSRYPRRRYREAAIFQLALLLICVTSFIGHPSLASVLFALWPVAIIALLRSPSTQHFIVDCEARFTAVQG